MDIRESAFFGRYSLVSRIGVYGSTEIWQARAIGAGGCRDVRLKILSRKAAEDSNQAQAFIEEALVGSRLCHPNIANICDYGEAGHTFYIAIEQAPGRSLAEIENECKKRGETVPDWFVLQIGIAICDALHQAYQLCDPQGKALRLTHRDINPESIRITYSGEIKIYDFGVASREYVDLQSEIEGLKGKGMYSSPEHILSVSEMRVPTDSRSDLFSLGVLLFELISGSRPFHGEDGLAVLRAIVEKPVGTLSAVIPSVSKAIEEIINKALEKNPDKRYQSAAEMQAELRKVLHVKLGEQSFFESELISEAERVSKYLNEIFPQLDSSAGLPPMRSLRIEKLDKSASESSEFQSNDEISLSRVSKDARQQRSYEFVEESEFAPSRGYRKMFAAGATLAACAAGLAIALAVQSPSISTSVASLRTKSGNEQRARLSSSVAPVKNGISSNEIVFGMTAPFSGPLKELGHSMRLGLETAFADVNDRGGIEGRSLRLLALDDEYDPAKTLLLMHELIENKTIFGVVGSVGTANSTAALPYLMVKKTLFFAPLSGSTLLRKTPPERYLFNYRASNAEETAAAVRYLMEVRRIQPSHIAVFYQNDEFGQSGVDGVEEELKRAEQDPTQLTKITYERGSANILEAMEKIRRDSTTIRAIMMVATNQAAIQLVQQTKEAGLSFVFTSVSAVEASSFAESLLASGKGYISDIMITQTVPLPTSKATAALDCAEALDRYFPGEAPRFSTFEGFIVGRILVEGLRRVGKDLSTENLVNTLEGIRDLDLGIGVPISFSEGDHQGSHKVWGTMLQPDGKYKAIRLE